MGANSVDYVYLLPAYPEADGPNAKMRISSHSLSCGGQVATALCTCAAMGLRAKYIGATGTDDNGRRLRHELAKRDIDMIRMRASSESAFATSTICCSATLN